MIFEREKLAALKRADLDYEAKMAVPRVIDQDLWWWKKALKASVNPIKTLNFKLEIYTDDSDTGWGATDGRNSISGFWNETEKLFDKL